MSKANILDKKSIKAKVGSRPGQLVLPDASVPPRYYLLSYREDFFEEHLFDRYDEMLAKFRQQPELKHWIDVRGFADLDAIDRLKTDFAIHPLQMEDVLNDYQRPKVEIEEDRLFLVSRMLELERTCRVDDDQLSVFTGPNYVLTLQSDYDDCLDPVRDRLRLGKGSLRRRPVMFLAHALLDVVVDNYFLVLAGISEYTLELEQELLENPSRATLNKVLYIKRELIKCRRTIWPERDKLNELLRKESPLLPDELYPYLKDVYDHTIQLIDLVESYRDMVGSMVDLYMSSVSYRLNEVMKVLTIISSIFIPLSFVASLYGMNFSPENPDTGQRLPHNMPELYWPNGYPLVLGLMGLMFIGQIFYFLRKGWLKSQ